MRQFVFTFFAVHLFFIGAAQTAEIKIGYVDMGAALNQVDEGKSAKKKLKKDFEKKQKQLDQLQRDLKGKKDTFDKQQGMMKPAMRMKKQEELQKEFLKLQQTYMQLQQELVEREAEVTQRIGKKIRDIVEKIGDREGYALVLDIGDTVLYHKRHRNITAEVVRDYNKLHRKR